MFRKQLDDFQIETTTLIRRTRNHEWVERRIGHLINDVEVTPRNVILVADERRKTIPVSWRRNNRREITSLIDDPYEAIVTRGRNIGGAPDNGIRYDKSVSSRNVDWRSRSNAMPPIGCDKRRDLAPID